MLPAEWLPGEAAQVCRRVLASPGLEADLTRLTGSTPGQEVTRNGGRVLYLLRHRSPLTRDRRISLVVRRSGDGGWELAGGLSTHPDVSDLARELRNLLLEAVRSRCGLPWSDRCQVLRLIGEGEWRLATEVLCTQLCEHGITPDAGYMALLEQIENRTAMNVRALLGRAGTPVTVDSQEGATGPEEEQCATPTT